MKHRTSLLLWLLSVAFFAVLVALIDSGRWPDSGRTYYRQPSGEWSTVQDKSAPSVTLHIESTAKGFLTPHVWCPIRVRLDSWSPTATSEFASWLELHPEQEVYTLNWVGDAISARSIAAAIGGGSADVWCWRMVSALCIAAALGAYATLRAIRVTQQSSRFARQCCPSCGYPVSSKSAVCPECGSVASTSPSLEAIRKPRNQSH